MVLSILQSTLKIGEMIATSRSFADGGFGSKFWAVARFELWPPGAFDREMQFACRIGQLAKCNAVYQCLISIEV